MFIHFYVPNVRPRLMRTSLKNISLIAIGLVTGVLATLQLSATAQNATVGPLPLEKLRLMADIFGQIKREYVEPVDDDKLLTEAIKGMVASLDPHSAYLDKKDFQELQEGTQGPLRRTGHRNLAGRRPGQGHQPD